MEGFSKDGYITDQEYFRAYQYRTITSDINGCGWIAAYNIRHHLGHAVTPDEVRSELDRMHTLRLPGPTTMRNMRAYLKKHVPQITEHTGRNAALDSAKTSECGILRYSEAGVPHFVSYFRQNGVYRFFNVNAGQEDFVASMDGFFEAHVLPLQFVSLFSCRAEVLDGSGCDQSPSTESP